MTEGLRRLATFCMVGLTCFGMALAVLAGLHEVAGVNYLIAYGASFVISSVAGYLLNARLTFAIKSSHGGAARYLAVNAVSLCVNTAAMKLLVSVLGIWYIAAAVMLAALNVPVSYFAQRLITYRLAIHDGRAVEP